jgi:hypothetical protein
VRGHVHRRVDRKFGHADRMTARVRLFHRG